MRLSVIFWTRANDYALPHLQRILSCLHQQTFQDFQSIVVCDREFTEKSFAQFYESMKSSLHAIGQDAVLEKVEFKTNINSDFLPNHKWVASYVRNFALQQVDTELVQLFDDDNGFDEEYLRQAILHYDHMRQQTRSEVIITPTLVYRDTKQIQNQGFSKFSYRQSRPILHLLDAKEINTSEIVTPIPQDEIQSFRKDYAEIQMFSGNGLLWNAEVFRSVGYDEEIARIAEDLDFTLSLHERGVKLFVFADLEVIEKRIPRIEKKALLKIDKEAVEEYQLLLKLKETLTNNIPCRDIQLTDNETAIIKGFNLLTYKPMLYVLNVSEHEINIDNQYVQKVKEYIKDGNAKIVKISAKIEEELSALSDEDRALFLEDLGIAESGLDVLIREAYSMLGLQTFFTAGEKECRAWTFKRGMKAPECAGIIHSDFEKGFIRAEVTSYDDFVKYGSLLKAKEAGRMRLEGKDYIFQDGDITLFRFNLWKH